MHKARASVHVDVIHSRPLGMGIDAAGGTGVSNKRDDANGCCACCAQTGNENQAFLSKWIESHSTACQALGKPFVLEEFGKNVTAKAKTPEDWKAQRTPMFSRAYSEYISSLENGGNYQGERLLCLFLRARLQVG
jgi:hypothetical protein